MRQLYPATLVAAAVLVPAALLGQDKVIPPAAPHLKMVNATVGKNLEIAANVGIEGSTSGQELEIKLTSSDPKKLLLSTNPEKAGSPSITVTSRGSWQSPEFYVQGLVDSGSATYTASAPGYASADATVTLAPSAFVIALKSRVGLPGFQTTTGASPTELNVFSVLLDQAHKYVSPQALAGGMTAKVKLTSSNASVGAAQDSELTMLGGYNRIVTAFQPQAPGTATLALSVPPGFTAPAESGSITATVKIPGIGITDNFCVGQNLQIVGTVSLGQVAPAGGVKVTLTSNSPNLLLSKEPTAVGTSTITMDVPAGRLNGTYFLQSLANTGMVTYTAKAPGYSDRTATIQLTPSGVVVIGPLTFPEGQLLNKDGPKEHGFLTSLAAGKNTTLEIYTVQLDPVSLRGADITVQALRAGMSITVPLESSDPNVGTVDSQVTIRGGSADAPTTFKPVGVGTTRVSVVTPKEFTKATNDTSLKAIVKP